jgi:serine/threonine protein kinase
MPLSCFAFTVWFRVRNSCADSWSVQLFVVSCAECWSPYFSRNISFESKLLIRSALHSWSLDIVRALDHLHNRNPIIMHRDLKPGELYSQIIIGLGQKINQLFDGEFAAFLICFALISANMMLTKDLNTLKLADFGMSKKMSQSERTQVKVFFWCD